MTCAAPALGAGAPTAQFPTPPLTGRIVVPTLVAFGVPVAPALLAVLGWRVVNYWLPIPAAGLSYLSLRVPVGGRPR